MAFLTEFPHIKARDRKKTGVVRQLSFITQELIHLSKNKTKSVQLKIISIAMLASIIDFVFKMNQYVRKLRTAVEQKLRLFFYERELCLSDVGKRNNMASVKLSYYKIALQLPLLPTFE